MNSPSKVGLVGLVGLFGLGAMGQCVAKNLIEKCLARQ